MKRYLILVILAFSFSTVFPNVPTSDKVKVPVNKDNTDTTKNNISPNWSDEQFQAYEDSLLHALYPEVRECHFDGTLQNVINTPPQKTEAFITDINNPKIPDLVIIDKTKTVGEIEINSGVTANGAKTYEVPIKIFPGMNNFQPNLSLLYNSQSKGSVVGQGWSLTGLSMITRSGKNLYYDDKTEGIRMDLSDSFYLDGIRLIKTSQNDSTNILYESETGNIRVVAFLSGDVVKHFQAWYPDGRLYGYGQGKSSDNEIIYPLTYAFDIYDNRISYTYFKESNYYYISRIDYNGGAHVDFSYKSRTDPIICSAGGIMFNISKLLDRITCYNNQTAIGEYVLSHSIYDNISHLDQIDYSSGSDNSLNPVRFIYGKNVPGAAVTDIYNKEQTQLLEWYESDNPDMIKVVRGRFDYSTTDDGLIALPNKNPYWKHYRHSTAFRHSQNRYDNLYTGSERIFLYSGLSDDFASPMPELTTGPGFVDILCADLQGKQEDFVVKINDIVSNNLDNLTFTVYRANPYSGLHKLYTRTFNFPTVYVDQDGGKSIHPKFFYSGDFNGDGKMEILAVSNHQPFNDASRPTKCYLFDLENNKILYEGHVFPYYVSFIGTEISDPWATTNSSDRLLVFDANGDGKTDICLINADGINTYTFNTNTDGSLNLQLLKLDSMLTRQDLQNKLAMVGEINGDGLPDIIVTPYCSENDNNFAWYKLLSNGDGSFYRIGFYSLTFGKGDRDGFLLHDIDNDGRTDLIRYKKSEFYTTPCAYNSFGKQYSTTTFDAENSILVPSNINSRNNLTRLLCLHKGVVTKYTYNKDISREQLLTGMISSLGVIEKHDYRSLCDNSGQESVYTSGGGASFPFINIREPLMVLAHSETVLNGELCSESKYRYENGVFHHHGLGFCGFEKIMSYDSHGSCTTQTFDPYNYSVLKSEISPVSEIHNEYSFDIKPNKIKKVLLVSKTEKDKLTGYSANISYTYDEYGYPTSESKVMSDGITVNKVMTYGDSSEIDDSYSLGYVTDQTTTITRGNDTHTERIYFSEFDTRHPYEVLHYIDGNTISQTRYNYDFFGNVIEKKTKPYESGDFLVNKYTYNDSGEFSGEIDEYGCETTYTYDSKGLVNSITDYTGTTTISYDSYGHKTGEVEPDGIQTQITYEWITDNSSGAYKITTSTSGKPTVSEYFDALGRTVRVSDTRFDGRIRNIDKVYDSYGNLCKESLPYFNSSPSQWKEFEYDSNDRLITESEPSGNQTTYSYNNASITTNENNIAVTRKYDSLGNLILSSDAAGNVEYDLAADGQPNKVTIPGGVIYRFYYDKYRRQDHVEDASAGTIWFQYDARGNINRRTSCDKSIDYLYDNFNRLQKVTTPEFTTTYTYDPYNRLTSVSSDNGTSRTVTYDAYGRVETLLENAVDGIWLKKDYAYNQGNISTITYTTQSGLQLTEQHGYSQGTLTEGRINGTLMFKLDSENNDGLPTQIQTGPIIREYYWDYGMPEGRSAWMGSSYCIQDHTYSFDTATANLTYREDLANDWYEGFSYDNLNRLTSDGERNFTYNSRGNITGRSDIGNFEYEIPNKPHALSKIIPINDRIPPHTQEISYTSFLRPDTISENGVKASFTYNGFSDRVKMRVSRGKEHVLDRYYLGDCYERDVLNSSSIEKLYLFGDYYDAPIAFASDMEGGECTCYILRDYLGSITHLFANNGEMLQEMSYDAWGVLRNPETKENFRDIGQEEPELLLGRGYTGHEYLPWFGLINMNARLYDPLTGRFLSPDPIVQTPDFTQGLNRFSYALNNPLKYIDQDGESLTFIALAAVIGAVINVAVHYKDIKASSGWNMVGKIAGYAFTGALAGGVGGFVGGAVAGALGGMTLGTMGFINGAITGASMGASSGFILGTGNSMMAGENFGNSLLDGLEQSAVDGVFGGITGGLSGGIKAINRSRNFWTGKYSNKALVQKAATIAEKVIGGKGHVAGTKKHTYATKVLKKYQGMVEERQLEFKVRSTDLKNYNGKLLILDVLDNKYNKIYDWKFGYPGKTLSQLNNLKQMQKYRDAWGFPTVIIKP